MPVATEMQRRSRLDACMHRVDAFSLLILPQGVRSWTRDLERIFLGDFEHQRLLFCKCNNRLTLAVAATRSVPPTPKSVSQPGKPRLVSNASTPAGIPSTRKQAVSQPGTPRNASAANSANTSARASGAASGRTSLASTPRLAGAPEIDGAAGDLAGLHLTPEADEREKEKFKERAVNRVKVEELVKKVKKDEEESGKKGISLIVVGASFAASLLTVTVAATVPMTREEPPADDYRPCRRWQVHPHGSTAIRNRQSL